MLILELLGSNHYKEVSSDSFMILKFNNFIHDNIFKSNLLRL